METATPVRRLFYRIPEAIEASGLPRSTIYELIRRREIEVCKLGARTLVVADSLEAWARRLRAEQTPEHALADSGARR